MEGRRDGDWRPAVGRLPTALLVPLSLWLAAGFASAGPPLHAGFAETDITPKLGPKPVYLAGFGPNRPATAIHDALKARAVVFRHADTRMALVSLDLVGFFFDHIVRVRAHLPEFAYVLVSSTHTHSGPDTLGLWGPNPLRRGVDDDYLAWVEKQVVAAVRAAEAVARPVTAVLGTVRVPELLHDAREPLVKHDELVAIQLNDPASGKPAGIIVQWNCHPETLGPKNTALSGDFVSSTVAELRQRRGCPVVYLTGTVGGLMTSLHVPIRDEAGAELADGTVAKTERYGRLLARRAEEALARPQPLTLAPLSVRRRELFVPLDNKLYLLAWQAGVLRRPAFVWSGHADRAEPAGAADVARPLCLKTEIAWLRLGQLDVAAIPGEIYPELVLGKVQDPPDPGADFPEAPIEPAIYAQLPGPHRMIVGLANDEIGYIIPKRQWDQAAPYCYGRAKPQYGESNSVGPEAAPVLCRAFRDLVKGRN
ncbi:MAG: hypothetical protein NZ700_16430 [Gemmataceae bacterium]|nr:hypothetical protein [Gemmataceae bacterium]MDW8265227.1 hypothetical protein [Gemmataceae bacterium]